MSIQKSIITLAKSAISSSSIVTNFSYFLVGKVTQSATAIKLCTILAVSQSLTTGQADNYQ